MKSAGNDVVALKAIDIQRTNTPAFYFKIITPSEQALYPAAPGADLPFQNFVWLLWSVKESVYKYLKQTDHTLIFSPTKIIIQSISHLTVNAYQASLWESGFNDQKFHIGIVIYQSIILHFRSCITTDVIATVVSDNPHFNDVYWGYRSVLKTDSASLSEQVRKFAIARLQTVLKIENLHIKKDEAGVPVIFSGEEMIDVPVSLAHHDHFVAYSFAV